MLSINAVFGMAKKTHSNVSEEWKNKGWQV
jgi:hypothetical protein